MLAVEATRRWWIVTGARTVRSASSEILWLCGVSETENGNSCEAAVNYPNARVAVVFLGEIGAC